MRKPTPPHCARCRRLLAERRRLKRELSYARRALCMGLEMVADFEKWLKFGLTAPNLRQRRPRP